MKSIVGHFIHRYKPRFKTKVLSELLNPQTSHQPSSFFHLSSSCQINTWQLIFTHLLLTR